MTVSVFVCSGSGPSHPPLGEVKLTIRYSTQRSKLVVIVHSCRCERYESIWSLFQKNGVSPLTLDPALAGTWSHSPITAPTRTSASTCSLTSGAPAEGKPTPQRKACLPYTTSRESSSSFCFFHIVFHVNGFGKPGALSPLSCEFDVSFAELHRRTLDVAVKNGGSLLSKHRGNLLGKVYFQHSSSQMFYGLYSWKNDCVSFSSGSGGFEFWRINQRFDAMVSTKLKHTFVQM